MADTLQRILADDLCNGCGACAAALPGRIAMELSADGYLRPRARHSLVPADQEKVRAVCGGARLQHDRSGDVPYDALWGPVASLAVGFACDETVRYQGSSGGVLSALCEWLVRTGRVTFVHSTGASTEDPIRNETKPRTSRDEILAAAGSRYGPSSPLAGIGELLDRGEPFAFVGKPCDVAALRRLAAVDPRVDRLIPYKFSFFCAGMPSLEGTLAVLRKLGVAREEVTRFRYRGNGWPGMATAVTADGRSASMDYESAWGQILNRHLQFRCKICVDGTGEFADIACADAWYGKDGYPDFAEREGRSLIVARTRLGESLVADAVAAGVISTEALPIGEIAKMQPYQAHRKRNVLARLIGRRLAGRSVPHYRGFSLLRLAAGTSIKEQLRNCVGTLRRSWR